MHHSLLTLLIRLYRHVSNYRRKQFLLLLVLTILCSLAEVVSLGAVVPFISIITQPELLYDSPLMASFIQLLGIKESKDLILPLVIIFIAISIIAGGLRILLIWVGVHIGNSTGADLSVEVFRRTLYQSYTTHIAKNSSEVISATTQKIGTATGVIMQLVSISTSVMLFGAIVITMFYINFVVTCIAVIIFGIAYFFIALLTKNRVSKNGQLVAKQQDKIIKIVQEGLGGIRDILIDGSQKVYTKSFENSVRAMQQANSVNIFIHGSPRYFMETLGMTLIAALVLIINFQSGDAVSALPILGLLALGAQRSLPLMQMLYGSWTTLISSKAALYDVLELLDQPLPLYVNSHEPEPLEFKTSIKFENVSFRYDKGQPLVIDNLNLNIPKGSHIGIIGTTGVGKSTTLDLLMGLLEPTKGRILIDDNPADADTQRSWQRNIAHVPQNIFLSDSTIAENIAFGVPLENIDFERVKKAAKQAHISEFIESSPKAYIALVGERGVRLSGGQRQRIGIARALYKQSSILIFDEATSALDNETEQNIMSTINGLSRDITLLIIAHRLTTLKDCSQVIELSENSVKRVGSYEEIVNNKEGS